MALRTTRLATTALFASLCLAACSGGESNNLAAIDNQLTNDADPALTSALEDQILVDPTLVQQSNAATVRPAETPVQAQYPVNAPASTATGSASRTASTAPASDAARVERASATMNAQASGLLPEGPARGCGSDFQYGPQWANRLPAEFPSYPGGRLTEAAGIDRGACRLRVVTFRTSDAHPQVLNWYRQAAVRAGFNVEHQRRGADHVLGGVNAQTDGAYYLIVTPAQGGSEVALIVNNGR